MTTLLINGKRKSKNELKVKKKYIKLTSLQM